MRRILSLALLLPLLAACGQGRTVENEEYGSDSRRDRVVGRVSGNQDGVLLFGTNRGPSRASLSGAPEGGGAGIGVNAYLWRASIDTLSFMPITSADPFGGVILTDWYSPPAAGDERFRAQVTILGRELRSDGVRVSVFRQERRGNGWVDSPVSTAVSTELEDRVLSRARELRSRVGA